MVEVLDLLVVGAGPTGLAVAAEGRRLGLETLVLDRGGLTANLLEFPTYMRFFTTRDRLEIAGIPFAVPDPHPNLEQALVYYRAVAERCAIPLALDEEVEAARPLPDPDGPRWEVRSRRADGEVRIRQTRAVVLATGYYARPRRLDVPGEDLPWVHCRYRDPYSHFGRRVLVVGGGNSAVEAALELWRAGVRVSLVHRGADVKTGVKYWLRPDIHNRIAEGSIPVRFEHRVTSFEEGGRVHLEDAAGRSAVVEADQVLVLIGYEPELELLRRCGAGLDMDSGVPVFDPISCETDRPGLYVAGAVQSGRNTDRIFIDNSREHAPRIIGHLRTRLSRAALP